MDNFEFEKVYTVYDYYDGIISGIADFNGLPHYFERYFDEKEQDWSETILLKCLENSIFQLAMEDWEIWKRWYAAMAAGKTTVETHPALPEDKIRKDEIRTVLSKHLTVDFDKDLKMQAEFTVEREGDLRIQSTNPSAQARVRWFALSCE